MEDIIILIITAALMIGAAISSANKKKKEAERKTSARPDSEQGRGLKHKSLSEILRELEEQNGEPEWMSETEPEPEPEYYGMGADSLEERAMAEARLEAMTYRPADKKQAEFVSHVTEPEINTEAGQNIAAPEKEPETLTEILGGGFDVKRAIIESEILKPRYEHY